jgi:hypothetical protein
LTEGGFSEIEKSTLEFVEARVAETTTTTTTTTRSGGRVEGGKNRASGFFVC